MPALTNSDVVHHWYNRTPRLVYTPNRNVMALNGRLYSYGVLIGLIDTDGTRYVLNAFFSTSTSNHIRMARAMNNAVWVERDTTSNLFRTENADILALSRNATGTDGLNLYTYPLGNVSRYNPCFPVAMLRRVFLTETVAQPDVISLPIDYKWQDVFSRMVSFRGTMRITNSLGQFSGSG